MKKILVYGFSSWGNVAVNISQQVVQRLTSNSSVTTRVLSTCFDENQFLEMVGEDDYDYALGLGRYPRGKKIRIEQRGFNRKKVKTSEVQIDIVGKPNYEVTWEIQPSNDMETTDDPGSFVCNYSMYILGKWATINHKKFAFLHIPKTFSEDKAVVIVDTIIKEQAI